MVDVFAGGLAAVKLGKKTLTSQTDGLHGPHTQGVSGDSALGLEKLTALPGTIVEMACL